VPVPPYVSEREGPAGVLNIAGIRLFSQQLAERISSILDLGRFPLVLGGDCSILIGSALGMRRRGRFGLFFIDGHADFYSPDSEPNGEVASMDLAIVTGGEPEALADLDGLVPLVREQDVVVFGFRDAESALESGSPDVSQTAMHTYDLSEVRRLRPAEAARNGVAALESSGCDGFWVHLDADVLNDEVMPAVDYRLPDGLWPGELTEALAVVLASPLAMGLEVTIYNPTFDDAQHSAGRTLTRAITAAFSAAQRRID
jgi:arginase